MGIKYNTQVEVNLDQYLILKNNFKGIVAYRSSNGKFFIKLLLMQYSSHINKILVT